LNSFSPRGENHKWGILAVIIFGSFMAILDNNIVNVALPYMMAAFGGTVDQIEWVVTAYMIAFAISMPMTSWLREVFGLKKVFIISMVLFGFGSALCGMAWDKDSLIVFRIIQAFGGGALLPTGLTFVSETFPAEERGLAMGIWSIGAMVAPSIGPFVGGYLVDEVSWRAIFYINLPVGVVATLAAFFVLPPARVLSPARRFDLIGFLSFSIFLAFLLIALAQGQREGWDSDYIISCFSFSLLGLVAFTVSAFRVKDPLIDVRVFANQIFLMANIVNFVRAMAIFGSLFLLPLFLQNVLDYKALRTGIVLAPMAISVGIVSPFSGLISDRIGPRIPIFLGTVLVTLSLYLYKDLSLDSDYWFLFWPQIIRGAGFGLINAPLISVALNSVRREQGAVASSLLMVIIHVGGAFGVALLGALLERRQFFHYAHYLQQINHAFSPPVYRAQLAMQDLLLKSGQAPAEVLGKGKTLLALWVQRQAAVGSFADAFVFTGLVMAIGIIPALLIRNTRFPGQIKSVGVSD
jgi:DHA2 family multidrug resistance protein